MATQLAVYQEALEHLGERPLASLSEDREPRRALDAAWDTTLTYCLEQGFWNWAMRSVEIEPEPAIEPAFGYQAAFSKPTDWLRTYVVSANDTFDPPLPDFIDENGYWMADTDLLYVRYVSNSTDFGLNLTLWPTTFSTYVALRLARRIARRITNSSEMLGDLVKLEARAKIDAMSKDAMNEGTRKPPPGTWVTSRGRGTTNSRWNGRFE